MLLYEVGYCDNCLKSLDDPSHKFHVDKILVYIGDQDTDVDEDYLFICDEPKNDYCGICGEIFPSSILFLDPIYIYYLCENCHYNELLTVEVKD